MASKSRKEAKLALLCPECGGPKRPKDKICVACAVVEMKKQANNRVQIVNARIEYWTPPRRNRQILGAVSSPSKVKSEHYVRYMTTQGLYINEGFSSALLAIQRYNGLNDIHAAGLSYYTNYNGKRNTVLTGNGTVKVRAPRGL